MFPAESSQDAPRPEAGQSLQEALEEARLLNRLSVELCSAVTVEATMQALARPWMETETFSAALGTVENDASGAPEWLTIVARWPVRPSNPAGNVRYHLPDFPASGLWRFSPDSLVLISDIENDERLDERARQVYLKLGSRSTIAMSIASRGRCVGFLSLAWQKPNPLSQRDRRLCEAMAKLAGLVLENRLAVERMEAALQDNQRQRLALAAILERLPVGVVVCDVPPTRLLLANPEASRIRGVALSSRVTPEELTGGPRLAVPGADAPLKFEELPLSRLIATGQAQSSELHVVRSDGTRLTVDSIAAPIFDEKGEMTSAVIVLSDVSARKQAEQERRAMQDALIRAQAAALAERSTPLIPITDDILVLPLIGSLDTERGQQLVDALLTGVSKRRARVAIIDITGVPTLDSQAAGALTQAAQALRLLGVEPVLTGIRAEVAQTLVGLGLPLNGIITRSTLQGGIAYARKRLDRRELDA